MGIAKLTALLNWKLLKGSHEFPGPEGGTCINEAAIVAAGLPYKTVRSHLDLPECFSPVLGAFLLELNDRFDDVQRQELIRFVPRLSGSADTYEVEKERALFLHKAAQDRCAALGYERYNVCARCGVEAVSGFDWPSAAIWAAASLSYLDDESALKNALAVAEEAFAIGKQADAVEVELVKQRMDKAREVANV
jgi:hypothetical protein